MKKPILIFAALLFLMSCRKDKDVVIVEEPPLTEEKLDTIAFTIPSNQVKVNPTGYMPLGALLTFTSPVAGNTEIVVKGKNGEYSDIRQTFPDNDSVHSIPVLGLYADYENTVEVSVTDDKGNQAKSTVTITTGPLPPGIHNYIHVEKTEPEKMEPGLTLVSSFAALPNPPQVPYMLDSYGDIRWVLDYRTHPILKGLDYDCGISRLHNGNFLFADQTTNIIFEIDIFGKIINSWALGQYIFHHDVFEKPNGNFLITVSKKGSTHHSGAPTIEDYIIEVDRTGGSIITVWDLKESLDEYRTTETDLDDWIHVNAVIHDPRDNTIIISGRVQGVVKLTYDNQVKWILGPHYFWRRNRRGEELSPYLLQPLDAAGNAITDERVKNGFDTHPDFEWNYCQHSPIILPNGNLALFDNGDNRGLNEEYTVQYSRAVEFKIDEVNKTVQQVWQYGKERGTETFSRIVSSVKYLNKTDHILFSPGRAVPNDNGAGGRIVEVDRTTKEVVFELAVSAPNLWGFHRAIRMPIYPNNNSYFQ